MSNPFVDKLHNMHDSITTGQGELDVSLRSKTVNYAQNLTLNEAINSDQIPDALRPYLEKVVLHAYKTTDQDIEQLKNFGYTEDEIFELTISAAFGAGYARYLQGISVLKTSTSPVEEQVGDFTYSQ